MEGLTQRIEDSIINEKNKSQLSAIQEFYRDTTIFVTGATGFLGKILLEKLLRSCPELKKIYVLVREKRGKNASQRIQELFEDPVFEKMKKQIGPTYRDKLKAVCGDCSITGLGLSAKDALTLADEVDIVFHVAATVRFDEKLRLAVSINVNGTRDVLDLCRQMRKLKSVIHVSTAYSNCHLQNIEEKFYDYQFNYQDIPNMLEKLDDNAIDLLTPRFLGPWPNTYSMTKAMAEQLVRCQHRGLPLGVFRPAIVTSTYQEPVQGWTDNYYGPTGVVAAVMMGILHSLHCHEEINANIVPVDMCVNALIASAWDVAETWKQYPEPKIYNYVSSVENPITWNEYNKINMMYGINYPLSRSMLPISFDTVRSGLVHEANMFLFHVIPAALYDILSFTFGKKKLRYLDMQLKVRKFTQVITRFSTKEWIFTNDNVRKLFQRMDEKDKQIFNCDMASLDWLQYFRSYVLGIRTYLFKDDISTLQKAKKSRNRVEIAYSTVKAILWYVSMYYAFCFINGLLKSFFSLFLS